MTDHVSYEKRGALGLISLKRSEALNALSYGMLTDISEALDQAEADRQVRTVAIHAPEGRAFSAGGDIRAIHDWGKRGRPELYQFYRDEYRLNARIKSFAKPYVALVHGIVMGGGAGVSLHGSHVVVAEDAAFAMPEVGIGMVPDIGGSHFLNRTPGKTGLYLALTGERMGAPDLVWSSLAKAQVPRMRFSFLLDALADGDPPDSAIETLRRDEGQTVIARRTKTVDRIFGAPSVEAILDALDAETGPEADWAGTTAGQIRRQCPTCLKVTFALLAAGQGASLEQCLINEFRAVSRIVQRPDFYEGVRAAVIDKDRKPRWRPDDLSEVSDDDVAGFLAPQAMQEPSFV